MNNEQLMVMNLVTKVGVDTALILLENLTKVTTLDDAVEALRKTQQESYKQLKTAQ